jgi:hypothetical protein
LSSCQVSFVGWQRNFPELIQKIPCQDAQRLMGRVELRGLLGPFALRTLRPLPLGVGPHEIALAAHSPAFLDAFVLAPGLFQLEAEAVDLGLESLGLSQTRFSPDRGPTPGAPSVPWLVRLAASLGGRDEGVGPPR